MLNNLLFRGPPIPYAFTVCIHCVKKITIQKTLEVIDNKWGFEGVIHFCQTNM